MRLEDILSTERISVRLDAADKPSALRVLAGMLVADEPVDAEQIARVFEEREAIASTGVGSGVAIPHGRVAGLARLRAAVGICAAGVEFDAIDGRPAHILVAVLGPKRETGEHLKALARFSRVLRRETVREQLIAAHDSAEALAIILANEG